MDFAVLPETKCQALFNRAKKIGQRKYPENVGLEHLQGIGFSCGSKFLLHFDMKCDNMI
jgi:hypothetical protein